MQRETSGSEKILQRLSSAIYNLRYILISVLGAIAIVAIVWAIVTGVTGKRTESSTVLVERAEQKFEAWIDEEDEEAAATIAEELQIELARVISEYPRLYAAQRAYHVLGSFLFRTENWLPAAESFLELADRFPKSYLAPVSIINAAIAYEEAGNLQKAVEAYLRVTNEYASKSPEVARVLFSLGRISEALGSPEEAIDYYNRLVDEYTSSSWTNLARDRIIYLNLD